MVFRRTLGCARGGGNEPSGYRFRRQRYAAKLIAFALFSSVRSFAGRRRLPLLSVVPTATSAKAAHASYMHVWAIASARATIGGPLRSALLRRTSARAAAFQSLTDRKSTRLNSSHLVISYAVFCLKKKNTD